MEQTIARYVLTRPHGEWRRRAPGGRNTVAAGERPTRRTARGPMTAPTHLAPVVVAEPPTSRKVSELMSALTHLALFVEAEKTRRAEQAEAAQRPRKPTQNGTLELGAQPTETRRRDKPSPAEWLSVETIERFLEFG